MTVQHDDPPPLAFFTPALHQAPLVGHESKIFLLDFFGAKGPTKNGIRVPASRILTAFPTFPGNTFLGFAIPPARLPGRGGGGPAAAKKAQGVIWGKDPKHYAGREGVLREVAKVATLHSTLSARDAPHGLRGDPNIVFHGHLKREEWQALLAESMFMLGLGNPLVGPSAVDAVVAGCVYLNPTYDKPVKEAYFSQHPYLAASEELRDHVCSARLSDTAAMVACAEKAVAREVSPVIPRELTEEAYDLRIEAIFGPFVPAAH